MPCTNNAMKIVCLLHSIGLSYHVTEIEIYNHHMQITSENPKDSYKPSEWFQNPNFYNFDHFSPRSSTSLSLFFVNEHLTSTTTWRKKHRKSSPIKVYESSLGTVVKSCELLTIKLRFTYDYLSNILRICSFGNAR